MEVILMYSIKAKLVFGCIFSFVVFGLILVGQSDALKDTMESWRTSVAEMAVLPSSRLERRLQHGHT
jgi:hypothetical protein